MNKPILFGADYSVYVRISRLALHEKGVDYELIPIDIFALDKVASNYLERQPFGKIPAFEHDGFRLYETGAITRYIDEAFQGSPLQPSTPKLRARVNQIISIADNYIYPQLVWGMYVELVSKAVKGEPTDDTRIATARANTPGCLNVLSSLLGYDTWFSGDNISLADLYVAPMIDYFLMVPEGPEMFFKKENLAGWWHGIRVRESFRATRPIN